MQTDDLMTDEQLVRVTGKRRYSKQAEWFKDQFGIEPVCAGNGKLNMTWEHFNALMARKHGMLAHTQRAVELSFD